MAGLALHSQPSRPVIGMRVWRDFRRCPRRVPWMGALDKNAALEPSAVQSPPAIQDITQRNVERIAQMEAEEQVCRTLGERIADRVAARVGSWTFLIIQS